MSITNSCLEADDFLPSEHAPSERCFVKALEAEFSWQVFKLPSFHVISSHVVNVECSWLQSGSLGHIHGLVVRDLQVEEKKKKKKKKKTEAKGQTCSYSIFFFFLLLWNSGCFQIFRQGSKGKKVVRAHHKSFYKDVHSESNCSYCLLRCQNQRLSEQQQKPCVCNPLDILDKLVWISESREDKKAQQSRQFDS